MIDLNLAVHKVYPFDGFGRIIRQLTEAMLTSGHFDVHPYPMEMLEWPGFMQTAAGLDHSRLTLFLCPPNWIKKPAPGRMWLYAMHESSQLPQGWAEATNTAEHLIVPSEWCAEVYRGSGVTIPISTVHPGVDFNECPVLPPVRSGARPYTFIALGDRGVRKGWDIAYSAFFKAFRADDNVSLILKTNLTDTVRKMFAHSVPPGSLLQRVRVWSERVDNIRDIFAQGDCVVYPAHGEGWGMFPREAASCGLPVIATHYSGLAVDCAQWAYPIDDYEITPATGEWDGLPGLWAHPSVDAVAEQMRWCYDHPDEARAKGRQSAAWLRQNATWEQSAARLYEVFQAAGQPARPIVPASPPAGSVQMLKQVLEQSRNSKAAPVLAQERVNGHGL